jgi:hypothetical protein
MNYFTTLKLKDYLCLLVVYIVGFGWLLVDQIFLPAVWQRFVALLIILLLLFYLQFSIIKPAMAILYANTISIISVLFIASITIVLHVFIKHDFSSKLILIWILAGALPYISGHIYKITKRKD